YIYYKDTIISDFSNAIRKKITACLNNYIKKKEVPHEDFFNVSFISARSSHAAVDVADAGNIRRTTASIAFADCAFHIVGQQFYVIIFCRMFVLLHLISCLSALRKTLGLRHRLTSV